MKRILDKITPSFIHRINNHLLQNSILGWQLQLPKIIWLWLLISILILPIGFLYPLDIIYNSDTASVIGIAAFVAILQLFLFGYILIQFNSTKSFGKRSWSHGIKEQLAYLFVMMLCLTNVIVLPAIIEWRTSKYMPIDEIKKEEEIYNKARHYFMYEQSQYRYFLGESELITYTKKSIYENDNENSRAFYYRNEVAPLLKKYFSNGVETNQIDSQYTREAKGPKLYYTGNDFLNAYASILNMDDDRVQMYKGNYKHQLDNKSDNERLKDIIAFINLNNKYQNLPVNPNRSYYNPLIITFENPNVILEKYKTNQFDQCISINSTYNYSSEESMTSLNGNVIGHIHSTVIDAEVYRWRHVEDITKLCFFIALAFSLLLFIFKNVRLREFILSFVYSALLFLFVIILTIITGSKEFLPFHSVFVIFLLGIIYLITVHQWKYFSSIKTIFVIFSNLLLPFILSFTLFYMREYHDFRLDEYSYKFNWEISGHEFARTFKTCLLWGGIILYILLGSVLYKKTYERIFALPLKK